MNILKTKSKILEITQLLYVEESLAHDRYEATARKATLINNMLQAQVTSLQDAKNVLQEQLNQARAKLKGNVQKLGLFEKKRLELEENQAAIQGLEELVLLVQERAAVA